MLLVDYELSPSWNRRQLADWSQATETSLRYDSFLGDIVFRADDADFSARWGWVPVLDFGLSLKNALEHVERDAQVVTIEFTESDAVIRLEPVGHKVKLTASYVPEVATVEYADLVDVTYQFLGRLIEDLIAHQPGLERNPVIVATLEAIRQRR
ncbi:MAG TPA: hypothetical protein DGG94_17495 [Micromonosporaceae bacterium]|nr:hypothetical protein [Micromonosporaceae bacterium]